MTDHQAKEFTLRLITPETELIVCGPYSSSKTVGKVPFSFEDTSTRRVDIDGKIWKVKGFGALGDRKQRAIVELEGEWVQGEWRPVVTS